MGPVKDAKDFEHRFAEAARVVLVPWAERTTETLRDVARAMGRAGILWRDIPPAYRKHGGRLRSRRELRDMRK